MITTRAPRRCRRPRPPPRPGLFLSTSNVAASASAFSFRASSRSRAESALLSSPMPGCPRSGPVATVRTRPAGRPALQAIHHLGTFEGARLCQVRIFSLIDQSRLGRFAGMTGRLLASCTQRESVCWRSPVSNASCRALTASLPVKRATIFCLNACRCRKADLSAICARVQLAGAYDASSEYRQFA